MNLKADFHSLFLGPKCTTIPMSPMILECKDHMHSEKEKQDMEGRNNLGAQHASSGVLQPTCHRSRKLIVKFSSQ
jgi:hypothetical protein